MAFLALTETTEIAALWFAAWTVGPEPGDVLATVSRAAPGEPWELMIRWRQRKDDERNPLKSADTKEGTTIRRGERPADDDARAYLCGRAPSGMGIILAHFGVPDTPIRRYDVNGGIEAFTKVWATLPFATPTFVHAPPGRPQ